MLSRRLCNFADAVWGSLFYREVPVKKLIKTTLALFLILALTSCATEQEPPELTTQTKSGGKLIDARRNDARLVDARRFVKRDDFEGAQPVKLPNSVKALVVPHHTVASRLAARLIGGLAEHPPETVVLLGPNHANTGPGIATTYAAFTTYHTTIRPDETRIRVLENKRFAGVSDALFEHEHSVGALVPLIAKYLPQTKIVPIVFHRGVPLRDAMEAIGTVYSIEDASTVIIASIDFSHGLPSKEEPARRAKILEYVEAYDWRAVLPLDETYLDAPVVLAALLRMMEGEITVFDSANAADLLGHDVPDATGYLTVAFHQ